MTPLATIVDWSSLAEAAYVSVAVGLGVLLVAALGVASSLKAQDERGAGRDGGAVVLGGVTPTSATATSARCPAPSRSSTSCAARARRSGCSSRARARSRRWNSRASAAASTS
jgi:hypothetical protein